MELLLSDIGIKADHNDDCEHGSAGYKLVLELAPSNLGAKCNLWVVDYFEVKI